MGRHRATAPELTDAELYDDGTLLSILGVATLHEAPYGRVRLAIECGELPAIPVVGTGLRVTSWVVRMDDAMAWVPALRKPVGRPRKTPVTALAEASATPARCQAR